jgi:hypothetical protein
MILKACSSTSLRIPGIVEGFHVKTSLFAQRKLTSVFFYLGGEVGTDAQQLFIGVVRVYGDLLGALSGLKGPGQSLGVGCVHGHHLLRGDIRSGKLAAL